MRNNPAAVDFAPLVRIIEAFQYGELSIIIESDEISGAVRGVDAAIPFRTKLHGRQGLRHDLGGAGSLLLHVTGGGKNEIAHRRPLMARSRLERWRHGG